VFTADIEGIKIEAPAVEPAKDGDKKDDAAKDGEKKDDEKKDGE
jgi:hypothetical protein